MTTESNETGEHIEKRFTERRSLSDRRAGERRRMATLIHDPERRMGERRSREERRHGDRRAA